MNPLPVETALKAYLAEVDALADLTIQTGSTAEDLRQDASVLVVEVAEIENVVGPLWLGTATVALRAPALATTRAAFDTLWQAVVAALGDASALQTFLDADDTLEAADIAPGGSKLMTSSLAVVDNYWVATQTVRLGLTAA
jgi:hypothetical protein